jgi:hypothetical protein
VVFKIFLSILEAYLIVKGFLILKLNRFTKSDIKDKYIFTLLFLIVLIYIAILISKSFYDRYFLNIEVLAIILIAYKYQNYLNLNKLTIFISSLLCIYILFLNIDFHNSIKLKFEQTILINEKTGLRSEISTQGSISRFLNSRNVNPKDLDNVINYGKTKCYIIRSVTGGENFDALLNSKLLNNSYLRNPTFKYANNFIETPKLEKFQKNIILKKEYSSPIYNFIGKRVFILSFCTDEVISDYNLKFEK